MLQRCNAWQQQRTLYQLPSNTLNTALPITEHTSNRLTKPYNILDTTYKHSILHIAYNNLTTTFNLASV